MNKKCGKRALVIGGSNGIGLSIALNLMQYNYKIINILDIKKIDYNSIPSNLVKSFKKKTRYYHFNLLNSDYSILNKFSNIDTLIITAGFGRVAMFENLLDYEINNLLKVDLCSIINIIKHFYNKINSHNIFYTLIMGSIAGHIASPLFSVYGAAKSGLCSFIENINIELEKNNIKNRILDVSPGSLKGTSFNGSKNNLELINSLSKTLINKMFNRDTLYIPEYDDIYKKIIEKYHKDPHQFGLESYDYKIKNNRYTTKPKSIVGYLSGTFDLFHIGHLNILQRAKNECDYLIVGIHKDGARKNKETFIPLNERKRIISSICYVDKVVDADPEDSNMWNKYHYDKLFVGSDYKGTERFNNYQKYFKDKNVKIVFFPYTKKTSSTKIRSLIENTLNKSNHN